MPVTHPKWKAEREWMEESMTEENSFVRYEQELWDRVAIAAMQGIIAAYADDSVSSNIAHSFYHADAFMEEREKRLNKG